MSTSETPPRLAAAPLHRDNNVLAALLAVVVFVGLSVAAAIASTGFLEGDGITHFLFARFAQTAPHYLWNVWGRPLVTALYMFPARIGPPEEAVIYVRFVSLGLALICGWATYRVARGQGHRLPALALIFLFGGPLFFLHSFSELTEMPFATLLILAFWAYQRKQFFWMAVAIGFGPLARPEGFGFAIIAVVALILHRRWYWIPVLLLPFAIWNVAGAYYNGWDPPLPKMPWYDIVLYQPWYRWVVDHWPYSGESMYKRGWPWHFVVLLPAIVPPLAFPAMWIGFWRQFRETAGPSRLSSRLDLIGFLVQPLFGSHLRRCIWLAAAFPLMVLVGHSALHTLGKMASSGEARYMLVVAPFWALAAARGWEWTFDRFQWRHALRWAGVAMFLPVFANLGYKIIPLREQEDGKIAQGLVGEYRGDRFLRQHYPFIMNSLPGLWYHLDIDMHDRNQVHSFSRDTMLAKPRGTYLIWDPIYGQYNANSQLVFSQAEIVKAGWVHLRTVHVPKGPGQEELWEIFLSPQDAEGQPTQELMSHFGPATRATP